MKKITLALVTLSTLIFMGCGGSSHKDTNKEDSSMNERFNYFQYGVVTSGKDIVCHQNLLYGDSYIIRMSVYHVDENMGQLSFDIESYRKTDCTEPIGWSTSYYDYYLNSYDNDNRVKIELVNVSFNENEKDFEIEKMVANMVFGSPILGDSYFTTVVGSGNIRTDKIKIGFAHPTVANDGSTLDKNAIDVSNYVEKVYYIEEPKNN